MKKNLFAMMSATAAMLAFSACSSDEPFGGSTADDGTVVLSVALPEEGLMSRAFSDGLSAPDLTYAVYINDGDEDPANDVLVKTEKISRAFTSRQASLSLNLVKGKTYDVVFWADNSAAGYTFDASTKEITVAYDGVDTNAETRDAFFNHLTFTVTGPSQQNVVLYRPFAQINLGTSDLDAATGEFGYAELKSALSISTNLPAKLNLLTGKTSGEAAATFGAAVPPSGEAFPVAGYQYVSMDYVLVGDETQPTLIDCEFTFPGTQIDPLKVNNVPVQRNFRTNIFGSLFTDATDIHILISPDFNAPDFNVPDWLDEAGALPEEKGGVYEIYSASQLAAVSKAVQDGNTFEGKVIKIMADIDLLNKNWTPIGMSKVRGETQSEGLLFKEKLFMGSIDGQNHTVRNLKVSQPMLGGLGLVGQMRGNGTYIKDLTVESADLCSSLFSSFRWSGAIVGYINAEGDQGVTIENCHAKSVHIGNDFIAASYGNGCLAGMVSTCSVIFTGCSVESGVICNIKSYNCGAVLGKIYRGQNIKFTDCSTKGVVTYNHLHGATAEVILPYDCGGGNGWLVGNMINAAQDNLQMEITGCTYNGAADWDNLSADTGKSLLELAESLQGKGFPYIGSFDDYAKNKGKITIDGEVVFENKQFK